MKRFTRTLLVLGLTVALMMALGGLATAATIPNPVPEFVNGVTQFEGFPDQPYDLYPTDDCRVCHGSTAIKHHSTGAYQAGDCAKCHTVISGGVDLVNFDRNCSNCHADSRHHTSVFATAGNCTFCHYNFLVADEGTGYGPNALEPVTYDKTNVTPTPDSCNNCHVDYAKYVSDPLNPSAPLNPALASWASHHDTVPNYCFSCHGDPVVQEIRICESCHTVSTLHTIQGHIYKIDPNTGMPEFDPVTGEAVVDNARCVGCHGDQMPKLPTLYPAKPEITTMAPTNNYYKSYDYITITGNYFGTNYNMSKVFLSDVTNIDSKIYAGVVSWTDTSIKLRIPAGTFGKPLVGTYKLGMTTPAGTGYAVQQLYLVEAPRITGLSSTTGGIGSTVTITGTNLVSKNSPTEPTVKFTTGGKIASATVLSYTPDGTSVTVKVPDKFNDGAAIYAGSYLVSVSTDMGTSNNATYKVVASPKITTLSPSFGKANTTVTIYGSNFGTSGTVKFGTATATISSWTASKIVVKVPVIAKPAPSTKYQTVPVVVNNGTADSAPANFMYRF